MKRVAELRQHAERSLRLKRQITVSADKITEPAAVRAITDLAEELEMTAAEIAKRVYIRERARRPRHSSRLVQRPLPPPS
jgi:hypothetical protein